MNREQSGIKSEQGFTLIEVMISVLVISIGIFGLMKLQSASAIGNAQAMKMTEGGTVLTDAIENILADTIVNYTETPDPVSFTAGNNDEYTITYTVMNVSVSETSSVYKQIHVVTSWTYGGERKSIESNFIKLDTET